MTIAIVSVWRQREDLFTPRMEAIRTAECEKLKELPSEDSHGGVHHGESELVPHAGILSHLTVPESSMQRRLAGSDLN
jgi:hypothetical protein